MHTEVDLDAVATDALPLTGPSASSLGSPAIDEEDFRLLSGVNGIFVAFAAMLLLWIVAGIGNAIDPVIAFGRHTPFSAAMVGTTAWALAEYFTRKRRLAIPSVILLVAFVAAAFNFAAASVALLFPQYRLGLMESPTTYLTIIGCELFSAAAAGMHWRRFRVPITVAIGSLAVVASCIAAVQAHTTYPEDRSYVLGSVFTGGVILFALAMRWDVSDRERVTRRSDVAFWLHLAAAPMIAHSVFNGLGVFEGGIGAGTAIGVVGFYVLFAIVALAIDRRALLVSSLVYVLYAMRALFDQFGAIELNVALTGLVIGSALLMLSAFWHPIRRMVVGGLPGDLRRYLPILERPLTGAVSA